MISKSVQKRIEAQRGHRLSKEELNDLEKQGLCKQCADPNLKGIHTCEKRIPKIPLTSKERNILDLAKNLQDELHIYCKGAAGSGDNFYARTFANLADRADELVKLLESAPETGEQRTDHAENLAKALEHSQKAVLTADANGEWKLPEADEPDTCPSCGKRHNRQCNDGWHI